MYLTKVNSRERSDFVPCNCHFVAYFEVVGATLEGMIINYENTVFPALLVGARAI